ncbi:MAG: PAS domain S-box protein [Promethearchaeota archaeon]
MQTLIEEYGNHFMEILETSIDYIYLHDKNGNIIDVNDVVVKNLGYSKKEIQKMKVTDFLLEEVSSQVSAEIKQTMETGLINSPKMKKVKKKDGNLIYVEANTVPLKTNGKIYAILGIGHDVTKYIEMDQKLKESEEKYYHLFNKSPYNISLFDAYGNLVETNGTIIEKLVDYTQFDFKGQSFINIASHFANSDEIIQLLTENFKGLSKGKPIDPIEFYVLTMKGRKIWLRWQGSKVEINGKLFIQVIIQDITERKKSVQKLKQNARMQNCLNKIITLGNESTTLQEFLSKSFDEVLEIVGFDRGGVFLYNAKPQHNILVHHKNVHPDFIAAVKDVNISKGVATKIFDKNKPLYIKDFSEFMKDSKELGIHSAIVVPLRSKDQYVGSMNIGSSICQTLPQKELEILVAIGKQMGLIIQKFESEKLLMESEEQYRRISENANDLISVINNKFEFEYVNEKIHKSLVGYNKDELIGMNGIILIHPDDKENVLRAMNRIIKSGNGLVIARIKHKNGSYIWAEIKGKMFKDKENSRKLLMVTRDISDRKEIEFKLKEHAHKLELLNEIIIGGTKASDLSSLLTNVLKNSLELLDFDGGGVYLINEDINKAELIYHKGLPLDFVDMNQYVPIDKNPYKSILKDNKPLFTEDYRDIDPEIYKKWGFLAVASIPLTSKNKVIGALNITSKRRYHFSDEEKEIFRSIGNQIGTIIEKIQAEMELKESEEKFRVIAEQSFMSIMVLQDGVLKYFNERLPKRLGYSAEEIKNWGSYEFAKVIHPDDKDFVLEQARKKQSGEENVINNYIYRSIRKDGSVGWVENFSKTINYGGRPADLVMSIDITDKKEAEALIIEENKRLLELSELRKDLITRVSHELKTPITAIYGAVQMILKIHIKELNDEILRYVEIGHRGCLRLKELVDNLLDVSRLEAKKFQLDFQKQNLVEIIIDCANDMKYLSSNRQLIMDLKLPHEAYMNIDKLRFRQVLTNLISNAIKNTPKEGKILIDLVDNANFIDIKIKDTGVGFTQEEKEKIFQKFGKIERYGMDLDVDIEGSGLGLFISKEIVELHGGQIMLESEGRNKGSTFTIRLFKK